MENDHMSDSLDTLLKKGDRALKADDTLVALVQFEMAHAIEPRPTVKAKLAYCLARERKQYQQAMALCREALEAEPDNPDHYYQLSRIYLVAGQKTQAIKSLRKGLKFKRHQPIIDELNRLGYRRPPVFGSLPRDHVLNRAAGILLARLGSR
jgi:tetratricopeptide (TPR) repeat protein